MDREGAFTLLGLEVGADRDRVEKAAGSRRAELQERLASAPTESLQAKYRAQLGEIDQARELLLSQNVPAVPGLRASQIRDLPGARPALTRDGEGDAAGARVAVREGQVLAGRYEIRRRVGAGGMGAVFVAFDRNRDKEIAVKVLLPGLLEKEQARERFLAEAKLSIDLSHQNIVKVFDVQREGDLHFITMELLEGRTLREEIVSKGKLSIPETLRIGQSLCGALSYAHQQTVHRDVKPENIFLTADGVLKLMDFGIARVMSASQLTVTGMSMGTAYYMAPEQLKGAKDVDGRADEYSVAVVLYELLIGEVPTGRAKSAAEVRKEVPAGMSEAIDRALSSRPEDRYPDLDAFSRALQRRRASMGPKVLAAAAAVVLVAGAAVSYPRWAPHAERLLKTSTRDRERTAKAEKARDEARKDADGWERWAKSAEVREPAEIAKARDAMKRGEDLLAAQNDEDSLKAFEQAKEEFRAGLERAKEMLGKLGEARKAKTDTHAVAREWEELAKYSKAAEPEAVRKARDAQRQGDVSLAAEDPAAAKSAYADARDQYRAALDGLESQLQAATLEADAEARRLLEQLGETRRNLSQRVAEFESEVKQLENELDRARPEELAKVRDKLAKARAGLEPMKRYREFCDARVAGGPDYPKVEAKLRLAQALTSERKYGKALVPFAEVQASIQFFSKWYDFERWKAWDSAQKSARNVEKEVDGITSIQIRTRIPELDASLKAAARLENEADYDGSRKEYQTSEKLLHLLKQEALTARRPDASGGTPLHRSAEAGDGAAVRRLLIVGAEANRPDTNSLTPLHFAARKGDAAICDALLSSGAQVDARAGGGLTPLHVAATPGNEAVVKLLVTKGADVNARCAVEGRSPLHYAIAGSREETARFLIDHGCDLESQDARKLRPLHVAAAWGRIEVAKLLLEKKVLLNAADAKGLTPLHHAALGNHSGVVDALLAAGAEKNPLAEDGRTPLHGAAELDHLDAARRLVRAKADLNLQDHRGATPLLLATTAGREPMASMLVEEGAVLDLADGRRRTSLHAAVEGRLLALARLLVGKKARLDSRNDKGMTPLLLALSVAPKTGKDELVALLLEAGASPTVADDAGRTPLHLTCERGLPDPARLLLDRGAAIDAVDGQKHTPLHSCLTAGHPELAPILIERGANVKAVCDHASAPIHYAAARGQAAVIRLLIDKGAVVDAAGPSGRTPLHLACDAGQLEAVRILCAGKAAVEAQDAARRTPLHLAVARNQDEISKQLLAAGARVDPEDATGKTPVDLAMDRSSTWGFLIRRSSRTSHQAIYFRELPALLGHRETVTSVAFGGGANRLVSAGLDSTVKLWDVKTGKVLAERTLSEYPGFLAPHPGGKNVAVISDGIRLWEPEDDRFRSFASDGDYHWVAVHPEGQIFAADLKEQVRLYDERGRELRTLTGHLKPVDCGIFSPDGKFLATGSTDGSVLLWDTASWQKAATLAHNGWVRSLCFSPDSKLLLTGTKTGELKLWEVPGGRAAWSAQASNVENGTVTFSPDGSAFASATRGGVIQVWNTRTRKEVWRTVATKADDKIAGVRSIAFGPEGRILVSAHDDAKIRVWGSD